MSVYYKPDSESERVRKGKYTLLRGLDFLEEDMAASEFGSDVVAFDRSRLWDYIQVSGNNEPFDGSLQVPEGLLMPFDKRGITDDEAVTIVDFIRGHCEAEPRTWFWLRFDCARPIVLICREGADIWVHNGELEGPVSGGGDVVILRIDDGECTIQGFGGWVS